MNNFIHLTFTTGLILLLGTGSCTINKQSSFSRKKTIIQHQDTPKKAIVLTLKTPLDQPASLIWKTFKQKTFWITALQPAVKLKSRSSLNSQLKQGETDTLKLTINRLIPFGKHLIYWERIDNETFTIQTRENGGYVKVWDNQIQLIPSSDTTCIIRDQLVLHGGCLTSPTALWAKDVLNKRHKNFIRHFAH